MRDKLGNRNARWLWRCSEPDSAKRPIYRPRRHDHGGQPHPLPLLVPRVLPRGSVEEGRQRATDSTLDGAVIQKCSLSHAQDSLGDGTSERDGAEARREQRDRRIRLDLFGGKPRGHALYRQAINPTARGNQERPLILTTAKRPSFVCRARWSREGARHSRKLNGSSLAKHVADIVDTNASPATDQNVDLQGIGRELLASRTHLATTQGNTCATLTMACSHDEPYRRLLAGVKRQLHGTHHSVSRSTCTAT